MLQDIDLKYVNGVITTTKRLSAATPQSSTDLTTKAYVDAISGMPPTIPTDLGMKAWTYDPALFGGGQTITDSTIYLCAVYVRQAMTVTSVVVEVSTAGTTMTAGANWVGLYNSAGTKLTDAAADSVYTSVGVKQVTIASQNLAVGLYWVAILSNGTGTDPQMPASNTNGATQGLFPNGLATAAILRFAVNGTAATTLPSTITPASNSTTGAKPFWAGLS